MKILDFLSSWLGEITELKIVRLKDVRGETKPDDGEVLSLILS